MEMPFAEVDRIVKMVPTTLNITIDQALADSPSFAEAYQNEPQIREFIDTAKKLEGLVRNCRHACGGRCDFAAAADRSCSAAPDEERRNRDGLRHEGRREARAC